MKTESTTVCKMCYMDINPKAKKCPYCQHWQNKWSMITFHPLFGMIPAMLIFLVLFGFVGRMFETTFSEGEPFSQYSSAVSIVETKMVFGVSGCEHQSPTVAILGKIQNDSPIAWEDVKLEATFFDKDGDLIDATQKEKYSFMVASQDKRGVGVGVGVTSKHITFAGAFRVVGGCSALSKAWTVPSRIVPMLGRLA